MVKKEQRYNLHYKAGDKIIERRNITKEEIDIFLNSLERVNESDLRITKVRDRDEQEER